MEDDKSESKFDVNDAGTKVFEVDETYREELDARILNSVKKHECISEPELLDRIREIYEELRLQMDENEHQYEQLNKINQEAVVKSCCIHYKGQHDNSWCDCTVICDLHDDDYMSRDACCNCEDFEVRL